MPTTIQRYHIVSGQEIVVEAWIGDAQAGGHAIFLGQTLVAQGDIRTRVALGDGAGLVGQRLVASSVAVDVQSGHDHVSTEVLLSGGVPVRQPIVQVADAPTNGAVSFLTIVEFVG